MPTNDPRNDQLLSRVRTSHARLEHALAGLTPAQLEAEVLDGGWSVKATLGHITWWEQVPLHAINGEPDEDLLAGEEWDTDRANAKLLERNRARPLDEVRAAFDVSYAALVSALEALPVARLDEPSPYGGTLETLIAGNTYLHDDEHAGYLAAAFGLELPTLPEA